MSMFNEFYEELQNSLNGYFIDYKIDEDDNDVLVLSFKIDCDAVIAINKNTDEIVLSFEDGNMMFTSFSTKNEFDKTLFFISDFLKRKLKLVTIKECIRTYFFKLLYIYNIKYYIKKENT